MGFSLLRALRAYADISLSQIKRDAKRLQRCSADVFGVDYPLAKCQEAYARARGFRNWNDAVQSLARNPVSGVSPEIERTEFHGQLFEEIIKADLELSESWPIAVVGDINNAATIAVCLWVESMWAAKVPGLLLVDTMQPAFQGTPPDLAILRLGIGHEAERYRVLDLREKILPVSIDASAGDWTRIFGSLLPDELGEYASSSAFLVLLESSLEAIGASHGKCGLKLGDVYDAAYALCKHKMLPPGAWGESEDSASGDLRAFEQRSVEAKNEAILHIAEQLRDVEATLGPVIGAESLKRPTIALFNSADPASIMLAGALHAMYYWRYVGSNLRYKGVLPQPICFVSDQAGESLPGFLRWSSSSTVLALDGEQANAIPKTARKVQVELEAFTYTGRRVSFSFE